MRGRGQGSLVCASAGADTGVSRRGYRWLSVFQKGYNEISSKGIKGLSDRTHTAE